MGELVEYFTHHYTVVLDNDQESYLEVRRAVREAIVEESPELTLAGYRAMGRDERVTAFAYTIGASVLALVEEWTDEAIGGRELETGGQLIKEVLITNGSDMAYALGEYYMPEDGDAAEFLTDANAADEDDDDDTIDKTAILSRRVDEL